MAQEDGEGESGGSRGGEDSDDEADELLFTLEPPSLDDEEDGLAYRQVTIHAAAYSTYKAVLVWLQTSYISFAPLSSLCAEAEQPAWLAQEPTGVQAKATRHEILQRAHDKSPSLPLSVSPKSVYRLAHFFEIPPLRQLALSEIQQQLSASNCATELFSETTILYEEVSSVILDFVAVNWSTVKASKSMKEVERKVENDELPGAGKIFFKLMARVSK